MPAIASVFRCTWIKRLHSILHRCSILPAATSVEYCSCSDEREGQVTYEEFAVVLLVAGELRVNSGIEQRGGLVGVRRMACWCQRQHVTNEKPVPGKRQTRAVK